LGFDHRFSDNRQVTVKNSINLFKRIITGNGYVFNGKQKGTFTEATFAIHNERLEWITGLNLVTDQFSEIRATATPLRNYKQLTIGAFVENNWKAGEMLNLETGLRIDRIRDYGLAVLPRVSALFKFSSSVSSRIGGGLGYKNPTIFTEESERLLYRDVLPVDENSNRLERSYGINADINYKTRFAKGQLGFSINHLFFYTRISDPLLLEPDGNNLRFNTTDGHIDSRGMETNVKLSYDHFKLFLGYTFTSAYLHKGTLKTENFLTPHHRVNSVLLYEIEEQWKAGLEAYYFSKQQLSDGAIGKSYWITGLMVEKLWEAFSVYVNFENFLDTRQTRFDSIYTGNITSPVFRDIYAPLDGFVVNGGVKLRL
jgi:iron complex outermembrane receptor protein